MKNLKWKSCFVLFLPVSVLLLRSFGVWAEETTVYSGTVGENISWTLNTVTGLLTLEGSGEMPDFGLNAPAPWATYSLRSKIKTVKISEGISCISDFAFRYCDCVTEYQIPTSVTRIGNHAFAYNSRLTELVLPEGLTKIGEQAFTMCNFLKSITIPTTLQEVDAYAFESTSDSMRIYISDLSHWCQGFTAVEQGPSEVSPDPLYGESYICTGYLYLNGELITDLVIPEDVTHIRPYAFYNCKNIRTVYLPAEIESTGNMLYHVNSKAHVLYEGTQEQWDQTGNGMRSGVTFHTDAAPEDLHWVTAGENYYLHCDICDIALTSDSCTHSSTQLQNAVTATCTKNGYTGDTYCTLCSTKLYAGQFLPATGHSTVTILKVSPTCTENGYSGDIYCTTCQQTLQTGIILPATGHQTDTQPQKLPTCTAAGAHSYVCDLCGEAQQIVLAALGHDFIPVPGYHPTCTEPGLTAGAYCSRCDKSYEQKEIPATGHDYSYTIDGREHTATCRNGCGSSHTQRHSFVEEVCICGAVRESTQVALTLGHTVSFDSDLQMNYRIKYTDLAAAVPAYVTEGAYLVVEKDRYSNDGSTSVETVILQPDLNADATRMVFSLPGIQSVEMGSELRAVLHFFDDEGYEFITTVDVYSVLAYAELCYDTFEYEFQPKLYTLLIDALNYGAAAQKHFNRRADCPVNAGMEAYQQYATQTLSEALTDVKTYVENDRSITAVTNMGFTVAFADRTELNVKLTLADGYTKEDITAVAVYDAAGQEVDRLTEFTELSDGRLQVTFRKIKSVNLRDMYYFVAFVGDQPASGQIGYSVEAYAKSILASDDLDLAAMVQCCIYYGDAAVACFGK